MEWPNADYCRFSRYIFALNIYPGPIDIRGQSTTLTAAPNGRGGGDRTRTDDPLLAKQVLSQLSYTPLRSMVGQGGFEPPTPRLSSVCSNQLSY